MVKKERYEDIYGYDIARTISFIFYAIFTSLIIERSVTKMTLDILAMSKEELINAIAEADELGKKLECSIKDLTEARDELLIRADILESNIKKG